MVRGTARGGRPFLELFSSAIREEHRFPFTEIFVFIYTFAIFFYAIPLLSIGSGSGQASDLTQVVVKYVSLQLFTPPVSYLILIVVILMMKNISLGLGRDLDRGTIQTYLIYPIKRRNILTARLLSAILPYLAIVVGLQLLAFAIIAPTIISTQASVFALATVSALSFPLLMAGVMTLLALRRSGFLFPVIIGVVLYPILQITALFGVVFPALRWLYIIDPIIALAQYYQGLALGSTEGLSLGSVYTLIIESYLLVIIVYAAAYYFFDRRLGV